MSGSEASRPLSGRHALVTGAGSGIGEAIAGILVESGARVTLAGRDRGRLEKVAARLGPASQVVAGFDVTSGTAIAEGMAAARHGFGPVSILVNNAGEAKSAPFAKMDSALWNHVIAVDLSSVYLVSQAAIGDLLAHGAGARIINVASTAGQKGFAYVSAYCAAKHGVIGLTRAMAIEYARTGLTVNAVCPGYTDTPMLDAAAASIEARTGRAAAEIKAEFARGNPQGRLIAPREVAEAVLWLALPGATSMTGQAIAVAGGEIMT